MLCKKIPIKIEFFKVAQKSGQRPWALIQRVWSKFIKNRKEKKILDFLHFLIHIYILCCVEILS